jgi:prophage regulatory protein
MAMSHWSEFVDAEGPDGAYLPWKKVEPRVGISRTTAWRLQKAGDFPRPYVVSPGRVAYRESEVEAWKASRGHRSSAAVVPRAAKGLAGRPGPRAATCICAA